MSKSFADRQKSYEEVYDHKIIDRLPVIIRADLRSAHKITKNLPQPYCQKFLELMANAMLHTILEMDGAVFGYHYSDEVTFVLRNDRLPDEQSWYQNNIQKLVSITASLMSVHFFKGLLLENRPPSLFGDIIFDSKAFALPSLKETVNHLIWRQQICMGESIFRATLAELSKTYSRESAISILHSKKIEEQLDILSELNVEYDDYYPAAFKRGIAAYKVPKIFQTKDGEVTKNKWIIDYNIPVFGLDKNFLSNILYSGYDVFRVERDLFGEIDKPIGALKNERSDNKPYK